MATGSSTGTIETEPYGPGTIEIDQAAPDALLIRLSGSWRIEEPLPSPDDVERRLDAAPGLRRVVLDGRGINRWDSSLIAFLGKVLAVEPVVARDDRQSFGERLGDQHAIERIFMMARQLACRNGVSDSYRER